MSAATPVTRGNPGPRWSFVRFNGLLPASIAGLPTSNARVRVGPPLNASGARTGFAPITLPDPVTVMLHAAHTSWISDVFASSVNEGMVAVFVVMSGTPLLATIDDANVRVGVFAFCAPGGSVAPVVT